MREDTILPRSLLFVPGDRAERFDKAADSGAHAVLLDLEDAVAPSAKPAARVAVANWISARPVGDVQVIVRINAADTAWHADDLRFIATLPAAIGVMLPKSEPGTLVAAACALGGGRMLYALVETVVGVLGLREMAAVPGLGRFAFGNVDFAVDASVTPDEDEVELASVRTALVLESRLAGLPPPVDGVSLELTDRERIARHAARAKRFGFGGKLCIHPRQVVEVNAIFEPSFAEIAWARSILAAFESSGGAAVSHNGKMVDRPVAERARQLLRR